MMHNNSFKTALTVAAIVAVAFAAPQPNKSDLSNEIIPSGGFVNKKGDTVSASWGGFQAAASLADDGTAAVASASGNGLGAGAGYGSTGVTAGATAGAGTGGYGAGTGGYGAGTGIYGSKPGSDFYQQQQQQGGGFFDRIFAIPINVLQSVNTYLNQKQQGQQPGAGAHGYPGKPVAAGTGSASAADSSAPHVGHKEPEAAGPDYGHGKTGGAPMTIPITALRSVQNLLNG